MRSSAGLVAVAGIGSLAGCFGDDSEPGPHGSRPPKVPTGTLRIANPGEPNFIDPSQALELTEWSMCRNVYDGLMEFDREYAELTGALATKWESAPDAKEWIFTLRDGVTFHDGEAFDSTAARKTLEYYKDKTWGLTVANLAEIDDSDPLTLRVMFSQPAPDFARDQTIVRMMSPKLIAEDAASKRAVGTGPYKFVKWNKGQSIILEANNDFWGKGPYFETIELRAIGDQTAAISALTSGEIDVVMKAPPRQTEDLSRHPNLQAITKPSWLEGHLIIRASMDPTSDVRVRQAIAWALDREAIVKNVLLDQATVATSPMPRDTYGKIDPETAYSRDLERARALLAQAGHPDGVSFKMAVWAGIRVLGEEVAQAVVGQLADAGINVDLDILEPGVATQDLVAKKPKYHVHHAEYGWANGGPFHFTLGTALGHAQYTGKELTALVEKVKTTPDGPERLAALADTQELFMQELPHLPLYHLTLSDLAVSSLRGYTNPKDGYFPAFQQAYKAS